MSFKFVGIKDEGSHNEMICYECIETCNLKDFALKNSNFKKDWKWGDVRIRKGTKLYLSTNFHGVADLGKNTILLSLSLDENNIIVSDMHPLWDKDDPSTALYKITEI